MRGGAWDKRIVSNCMALRFRGFGCIAAGFDLIGLPFAWIEVACVGYRPAAELRKRHGYVYTYLDFCTIPLVWRTNGGGS